jgi:hypothetical protein
VREKNPNHRLEGERLRNVIFFTEFFSFLGKTTKIQGEKGTGISHPVRFH